MLDQFLISKGLLFGNSSVQYVDNSVAIDTKLFSDDKPVRFGRPSSTLNENGYSDHFPISIKVEIN